MNSANCSNCPNGYTSDSGSSKCQRCEAGKYGNNTMAGNEACENCVPGQYRANKKNNVLSCVDCPKGYTSDVGSTRCQTCDVGKYNNIPGISICKSCPIGYASAIQDSHRNRCIQCPLGEETLKKESSVCTKLDGFCGWGSPARRHIIYSRFPIDLCGFQYSLLMKLPQNAVELLVFFISVRICSYFRQHMGRNG